MNKSNKKYIAWLVLGLACAPIFSTQISEKLQNFVSNISITAQKEQKIEKNSLNGYIDSVENPHKQYGIEVHFTPDEDCTKIICDTIAKAQKTIHIQAYSFTCRHIWAALLERWISGVRIEIILDSSQEKAVYSLYKNVINDTNIPIYIDTPSRNKIAHNKVIMIDIDDGGILITGSFNFSRSAQKNAENVIIIDGKIYTKIAKLYKSNWEKRRSVSKDARLKERS